MMILRVAAAVLCFASLGIVSVRAQDDELKIPPVQIPRLPAHGADAKAFAPPGWVVQRESSGDLNGDGKPDIAFVLQDADKRNVVINKSLGVHELDTNPRILGIAFAAAGGGYTLAAQNSTLIARYDEPTQSDPFGEEGSLEIKRGAVQVALYYFSSAGGWDTGTNTFTFRWQNNRFELIGFDNSNSNRSNAADSGSSVNYMTGIAVLSGSRTNPNSTRSRTIHLPKKPLKTLDNVGDGMEFEYPGQG